MNPLISVCIPTYNAADYIEETLKSITSQTWANLEIIVGDNASNDCTQEIVESYRDNCDTRIRYYKNVTNLGYAGNCNKLIESANGDYICIFHSDDIYDEALIEKQVEILTSNLNSAAVFCFQQRVNSKLDKLDEHKYKFEKQTESILSVNLQDYLHGHIFDNENFLVCPSSMVRKEVYIELGGYDTNLKYIEDQDMWTRILQKYQISIINEKLILYRCHELQGSSFYSSVHRNKIKPSIAYLKRLIAQDEEYSARYKDKIAELEAVDLIDLALNAARNNNESQYIKLIKDSFECQRISRTFWKHAIIQNMPTYITFRMLRLKCA